MSRIGKKPVPVPEQVTVKIDGTTVTVSGPKGTLTQVFHPDMTIEMQDGQIVVSRPSDKKQHRALHGLTRSLIANMIEGVTKGYQKELVLEGVGYRVAKQGNKLVLSVGYSHPVEILPPDGIEVEVPNNTQIVVKGIDKQLVGQFAAQVRAVREPEPYKGKGIRYKDEHIRRKVGKTG